MAISSVSHRDNEIFDAILMISVTTQNKVTFLVKYVDSASKTLIVQFYAVLLSQLIILINVIINEVKFV